MSDYKELPCRRCGRVWKWAFDKKSEPYCPEGYGCKSISEDLRQIEILERILDKLDRLEKVINKDPVPQYPPTKPYPDPQWSSATKCSKCGIEWKDVMGYVCHRIDCPVQPKVTSISTSVPYQTYNSSDFEIESLDPDKRFWYYDGDGTKRRKE